MTKAEIKRALVELLNAIDDPPRKVTFALLGGPRNGDNLEQEFSPGSDIHDTIHIVDLTDINKCHVYRSKTPDDGRRTVFIAHFENTVERQ
jgi:hypothetical protein